jgi:predicted AAA+ superfamily ATPase
MRGLEPLIKREFEGKAFSLIYRRQFFLTSRYPKQASLGLLDGKPEMNFGGVYENFVAQEFTAHGFDLRYYAGKRIGEIDFVIERRDGRIIAIEVKSGSGYRTHASLTNALAVQAFDISEACVLAETNLEKAGNILYLPVYMAALLRND